MTDWNPLPMSDRHGVGTRNPPGVAVKWSATLNPLWGHPTRHFEITPWPDFFSSLPSLLSRLLSKAAQGHTNPPLCLLLQSDRQHPALSSYRRSSGQLWCQGPENGQPVTARHWLKAFSIEESHQSKQWDLTKPTVIWQLGGGKWGAW